MGLPIAFRDRDSSTDVRRQKKKSNSSRNQLDSIFKELEHKVITLIKNELKRFRKLLSPDYPACTERKVEDEEDLHSVRDGALKITLHVLKNMNHTDLVNTLHNTSASVDDSGVKLLSDGLKNPQCTLEKLRMENCSITDKGCAALASALRSNSSSHLRELDLNCNNPGESGVKLLSDLLKDPHCKLETLHINDDTLTRSGV
ncbi:hypothetical protein Q7C36_007282 [Tachysurus vachellii]|uniref:Uncharacterized protein n=1 Tax=Tachysurus vachellii TaxID=175792 RepID=A0AA88NB68_TACVA|nr:hypothetical protein Q7C36_007282 [Tachysurus vachellii]